MLYEVAPLAYVVEAAGGASHDGLASALDKEIRSTDERGIVSLGSVKEVEKTVSALQSGLSGAPVEEPALARVSALPYGIG